MGVLMKADLDDEQLWKAVVDAVLELPASELYPFNEGGMPREYAVNGS